MSHPHRLHRRAPRRAISWRGGRSRGSAAAAATLSDAMAPRIGMHASASQRRLVSGRQAAALGAEHDRERLARERQVGERPVRRRRRDRCTRPRRASRARARPGCRRPARSARTRSRRPRSSPRSRSPARCDASAITMPVTPAVSAARTIAPRLRGSVTPSSTTRNACGSASSASRSAERNGSARDDALRRVGLRHRAQALGRHHPQLRARRLDDRVDHLVAIDAFRHRHAAHRALARAQQLEHRAPPFDLGAARRPRRATLRPALAAIGHATLRRSLTGARWCRRSRPRA